MPQCLSLGCSWCASTSTCYPPSQTTGCPEAFATSCVNNVVIISATLGGGVIAAIVIAVVVALVLAGLGTKAGVEYFRRNQAPMTSVQESAIHIPAALESANPIAE